MSLNEMFGSSDSEVDSAPEDDTREGNPTKVEQDSDADTEQNIEELPSTQAHMQELFGDSDDDSNAANTEQQQQPQVDQADQSSSEDEGNQSGDEEMASEDDAAEQVQEEPRSPESGGAKVDHKQEIDSDADNETNEARDEDMDSDNEEPKQEPTETNSDNEPQATADSDNEPQATADSDSDAPSSPEMTLEKSPPQVGSEGSDREIASPSVDDAPQVEDQVEERRQRVISESEASSDDENRVHEKLVVEEENQAEEEAQEDFEKAMLGIEEDAGEEDFSMKALPTAEDLFGDGLDVSSDESGDDDEEMAANRAREAEESAAAESAPPVADGEAPAEEEEGVSIEIELPKCAMRLSKDMYFIKLPNFLSVETKPFDAAFYEDEIDEDEVMDEEGRSRLKLKVENTMRWRYGKDKDGVEIKESNSRIVKWSDGSLSLHLGNEIFDILKLPIQGEQNHLFVQQGTGLQAQAVFKDKLSFRPHSTASQTHRKMTLSIAERMAKAQKIRMMPATERDPESQRSEMETRENERMRSVHTREGAQRRLREKNQMKAAGGMSRDYLEEDADEDNLEESLSAIKDKYKKDARAVRESPSDIYSSDSSDAGSDAEAPDAAANKSKPEQEQAPMLDIKSDEDELPAAVDDDGDEDDDEKITTDRKKTGRKIIEESDDDGSG